MSYETFSQVNRYEFLLREEDDTTGEAKQWSGIGTNRQ